MTRRTFSWFPLTLEADRPRHGESAVHLGFSAYYDDAAYEGPEFGFALDYGGKEWSVDQVVVDTPEQFTFVSHLGEQMTLRHTIPSDAAASEQFDTSMPLPVEIIGAIMNGTTATPTLAAAVDNEGDVHTMILETGLGLYARYANNWLRLTDISPLEQLDIVNVDPDDLTMYDEADQAGNVLSINDFNVLDAPYQTAIEAAPVPVTASAPTAPTSAILVASADDIDGAIDWANTHPESRWYVTRRARAFGRTDPMPWEEQ